MKKIIEQTITALLRDLPIHDPARVSAAADILRAAYPNGIDAVGGGQSPGDPPPTNPFDVRLHTIGIDKVGGGQSPGDPPPTNPFGKGNITMILADVGDGQPRLARVEVAGKSVALDDVGTIEKIGDNSFRFTIPR